MSLRPTFAILGLILVLSAVALPAAAGEPEGGSSWGDFVEDVLRELSSLFVAVFGTGDAATPASNPDLPAPDDCKIRELVPGEATGCLEPGG